ncbi:unnamed protein product (macronuclear) [Paramecium tetraurelia]|uniref:Uncharacterized protein n=1 Tax=Paramecium tetraurelia TaxID=5888 RepID=A0EH51_PARTE|nr:uncharacterized protein GSPATT00026966001 [Paramecium tetraurelia]CAK94642.1 unnamed protein product [Paramecium tetraurelia]|eukprot:XP_001462015.1 hypothetical protein (macronuclear) [Paramecium tetraurelia strain d4-2]
MILSRNYESNSNLTSQNSELLCSQTLLPQQSLCLNKLNQTESPLKRMRTLINLRIKDKETIINRICKSFELRNVRNTKKQQQRRKSGSEQLSQKQLHLDYQYPKTIVKHQEVVTNELQRTKERKRTVLKRMSSILLKHQTTIRNINNQGNQKDSEVQLLILQQQQQGNDEPNVPQSQEVKKQKLRSFVLEPEQSKVVLDVSRKSKKPFASIQTYINEKATMQAKEQTMNPNNIVNQTNPFMSFAGFQSLTEMNGLIQNKSLINLGRYQVIKPTYPLPKIKMICSARNNCSLLDTNFLKQKKPYINNGNTQRKQRISTNS